MMQPLRFLVSPNQGGWTLSVGPTVLASHSTLDRAVRAAVDMARRTRGNNRVFLESEDGQVQQHWPA
ncbi:DUF2188 domain-containing protein [Devosia insulae]|uniref:DUF2188 domain-containing protein n=1 Tax=Devosia insulae TaxID=408174 RepID=UPI000A010051